MQQDLIGLLEKWLKDESFHHWANQSNSTDYHSWEEWLSKHPEYKELAEIASQIIRGVRFQDIPVNQQRSAQALKQVLQRLSVPAQPSLHEPVTISVTKSSFLHRYRLPIAASIALLIFAGIFLFYHIAVNPYVVVQTDFGEKKEMVLPDQTEVVLNANSQLRYARQHPREVWLKGEAFFQVKRKPETNEKFLVITDDLTIEVLGTAFNVSSRDKQTKVFLEEGKVKLNLKDEAKSGVMLSPGEILTYSAKQNHHYEKKRSETQLHTSWKEGVLILNATPLQEVIEQMEDLYGVRIALKSDTLRQRKMTMALPIESLHIALATIENTLGLHINQQDSRNYVIE